LVAELSASSFAVELPVDFGASPMDSAVPGAGLAAEMVELYHERWELELGYDEIKTHTRASEEAIRSETPERVRQEVWGIAIAYNLVRREMEAMAKALDLPPRRISFRGSLLLIRDLFVWASVSSPGSLPKMVTQFRLDLRQMILPPRRSERCYPRHVKIKMRSPTAAPCNVR